MNVPNTRLQPIGSKRVFRSLSRTKPATIRRVLDQYSHLMSPHYSPKRGKP
jgi:transcriptional regulator of heat shock response